MVLGNKMKCFQQCTGHPETDQISCLRLFCRSTELRLWSHLLLMNCFREDAYILILTSAKTESCNFNFLRGLPFSDFTLMEGCVMIQHRGRQSGQPAHSFCAHIRIHTRWFSICRTNECKWMCSISIHSYLLIACCPWTPRVTELKLYGGLDRLP